MENITDEEYINAINTVRQYQKQLKEEIENIETNKLRYNFDKIYIDSLPIGVRAIICLKSEEIYLVSDLLEYLHDTSNNLLCIRNFGMKSYKEIEKCLMDRFNYSLKKRDFIK